MGYNVQEDFIARTLKIIAQYDKCTRGYTDDKKYEETLFVNCLMGILIITEAKYLDFCLKDRTQCISVQTKDGQAFFLTRENVEHLRVSVAHYNVELKSRELKSRIEAIKFSFKKKDSEEEFRKPVEFELAKFKPAIVKFGDQLLNAIKEYNSNRPIT